MKRSAACLLVAIACGGGRHAAPPPAPTQEPAPAPSDLGGGRACHERYDDDHAARAAPGLAARADALLAAARAGDQATLTAALTGDDVARRAVALEHTLTTVPAGCTPIWYAQPGRLSVQPPLEGAPVDPTWEQRADALDAAHQLVATCDGGCAVLVIALAAGRVIELGPIEP